MFRYFKPRKNCISLDLTNFSHFPRRIFHDSEAQVVIFYPLFFLGKVSSFEEEDGTGTGRNEVRIKLSRGDLGSQFTCQAENEAIDQPLSTSVQVDVNRKSTPVF